ncbi:MAG: Response regulator protein TodT [Verrucomicrobiae bacterium]|nr:Response regulator protein TodT [Verrucomicrobiae bacterium]
MNAKTKLLIAIVDDDPSVCRGLRRLVRSLNMEAQSFSSGRQFLELLEALPSFAPDCVVLDIQMSGVNGLEVQSQIRQHQRGIPVIFMTAHDEFDVRERALAGGAVAYLRKPFNDGAFSQTLRAALAQNQRGADPQ